MELNPNHPVTSEMHDHWHKLCAILMLKMKAQSIEITEADVRALGDNEHAICMDQRGGRFVLRMMTMKEAQTLARNEGGLPV